MLAVALVALSPAVTQAGTVFFTDGRGMEIREAWIDADGLIRLRLPGGGIIGTDPARVARVVFSAPEGAPEPEAGEVALAGADAWQGMVAAAARRYGVDEKLVRAVVQAESGFDPAAISPVGAVGLMQLMPGTAADLDVEDSLDPEQNLDGGVRYLKGMMDLFDGRLDLALAAYNAGPAAVSRYGGVPPFPETRAYIRRILELAKR